MIWSELNLSGGRSISPELIAAFEREFGVVFPEAYKRIVSRRDGATCRDFLHLDDRMPVLAGALGQFQGERFELGEFLSFTDDDRISITARCRQVKDVDPLRIPFAEDAGGMNFVFDFRENMSDPPVLLIIDAWTYGAVVRVANSFDDLVARLTPNP